MSNLFTYAAWKAQLVLLLGFFCQMQHIQSHFKHIEICLRRSWDILSELFFVWVQIEFQVWTKVEVSYERVCAKLSKYHLSHTVSIESTLTKVYSDLVCSFSNSFPWKFSLDDSQTILSVLATTEKYYNQYIKLYAQVEAKLPELCVIQGWISDTGVDGSPLSQKSG